MGLKALGIFREVENSPNREADDALLLGAVAEELARAGVPMALASAEEADAMSLDGWDLILPMCESYRRLRRLDSGARGAIVINRPGAVLETYRSRMLPRLAATPGVRVPESERRPTGRTPLDPPGFSAPEGFWIKRGDVHNTVGGRDVVFAPTLAEAENVRGAFASREISELVLQRHVEGDRVKFYGGGPGSWLEWFYHNPRESRRRPFSVVELGRTVAAAAGALGLEIYGGDAVVDEDGSLWVIDVNSWPSFSRVRRVAARRIARHVVSRVSQFGVKERIHDDAP